MPPARGFTETRTGFGSVVPQGSPSISGMPIRGNPAVHTVRGVWLVAARDRLVRVDIRVIPLHDCYRGDRGRETPISPC